MKKVVLGIALLNQLVNGMDLPNSSSGGQEQQSNQLVSVTNARETTVAQLPVNDLQDMIRNSVRESVSAVMGDQLVNTREFQVSLNVVSLRLRDAFQQQMNMQAVNFQTVLNRQEDEHQREIEARDAQLEEARNERIRVEREKELQSQISRVFVVNKSLKPEKIMIRSAEINRMTDIFRKHNAVQNEYSKLALFSGLYGREDLEVKAKQSDLTKLSEYVSSTRISPKPVAPALIRDAFRKECLLGSWYYVFPDEDFIRGKYGLEYAIRPASLFDRKNQYDVLNRYNHCKDVENAERMNTYNNAMSRWNAEVSRASAVPLPSEEFDLLIEQFNTFLSKL